MEVVDFKKARLESKARKGFRNWKSRFKEEFGAETRLVDISDETLSDLTEGKEKSTFYLFDLIMGLRDLGSGFELNQIDHDIKLKVMDCYLFLIDRIRFEYMKRLGWLSGFPGEEYTLVEMVIDFDEVAEPLKAIPPRLSKVHSEYDNFQSLNTFEKEEFIRKLIPDALSRLADK